MATFANVWRRSWSPFQRSKSVYVSSPPPEPQLIQPSLPCNPYLIRDPGWSLPKEPFQGKTILYIPIAPSLRVTAAVCRVAERPASSTLAAFHLAPISAPFAWA